MKYARAYTYDTSNPKYINEAGAIIQATTQWYSLITILYKLGVEVSY